MIKLRYFIVSVIPFFSPLHAVELGPVKVDSYLNESLMLSLPLGDVDSLELADIKFSIADRKSYQLFELERPDYLNPFTFKIISKDNKTHMLHISTRQRVVEPILNILLQVSEKNSNFLKQYTLLMDPRFTPSVTLTNSVISETNVSKNQPEIASPVLKSASYPAQNKQTEKPVIPAETGTILARDRSISIIAQNSELSKKYSVYQIMRAFYIDNSNAFENGNIDKLLSGSVLTIPSESLISQVPRQKAINFVYRVSKDQSGSAQTTTTKTAETPTSTKLEQSNSVEKIPPAEIAVEEKLLPKISMIPVVEPFIEKDLSKWQGMSDEFATLSAIVETQNRALEAQNIALQSLTRDVESQQQKILKLTLQLNQLSSLTQTDSPAAGEMALNVLNDRNISDQLKIEQQATLISTQEKTIFSYQEQLTDKDDQIQRLNNQLNATQPVETGIIEPVAVRPQDKPIPLEMPSFTGSTEIAAPEIVTYSQESAPFYKRIWFYLLLLIAALVYPVYRFSKNHPEKKTQVKNEKPNTYSPSRDHEAMGTLELDHIEEKQIHRTDNNAVTEKSSLRLESGSLQEVKIELDVLLAYEQYNEALDLLEKSRENFGHESWIDLRELEILASSKQCEKFLARFNQSRESLEHAFPLEWAKIEKMRDELCSELKVAALQ